MAIMCMVTGTFMLCCPVNVGGMVHSVVKLNKWSNAHGFGRHYKNTADRFRNGRNL